MLGIWQGFWQHDLDQHCVGGGVTFFLLNQTKCVKFYLMIVVSKWQVPDSNLGWSMTFSFMLGSTQMYSLEIISCSMIYFQGLKKPKTYLFIMDEKSHELTAYEREKKHNTQHISIYKSPSISPKKQNNFFIFFIPIVLHFHIFKTKLIFSSSSHFFHVKYSSLCFSWVWYWGSLHESKDRSMWINGCSTRGPRSGCNAALCSL